MTTRYDLRNIYYTYQIGKCTLYRIDVANKSYAMYTRHHYRTQEPTLFYTFKSLDKQIVRKFEENTLEFFCLISNFGLIWLGNFDVPAKTDLNIKFRCKYDYNKTS